VRMTSPDPKRVLGIDLSFTSTGLACARWTKTIRSSSIDKPSLGDWSWRIIEMADQICEEARLLRPHMAVIEAPALSSFTGMPHERAGLWWAVVCGLKRLGIVVCKLEPRRLKLFLSLDAKAQKKQQVEAARAYSGLAIRNDDEADAWGLAAAGHEWLGCPLPGIPDANRAELANAPWLPQKPKRKPKPRKTAKNSRTG
jgi:Holliday junction resolvasome RuvABC endonuclease subunit